MKLNIPKTISTMMIASLALAAPAYATCSGDTCMNDDQTSNSPYMGGSFTDVDTHIIGGQRLRLGTLAGGEGDNVIAVSETDKESEFGLASDVVIKRDCDTPVCGDVTANVRGFAKDRGGSWGYSGAESSGTGPQFAESGVENFAMGEQALGGRVTVLFGQSDYGQSNDDP